LDNGKSPNMKNNLDANMSLFSVTTLPQRGIPLVNRSQIEEKVRSNFHYGKYLWAASSFGSQDY
jgi:hypothetical protein